MVQVITDSTDDVIVNRFYTLIDNLVDRARTGRSSVENSVAFDLEGVNLSRAGTVEVVSIAIDESAVDTVGEHGGDSNVSVFLVDFGVKSTSTKSKRDRRIEMVKKLLECEMVEKIIHDCRMDCDALFHLHGITLKTVHDTSCFHHMITFMENVNLNDVLSSNGIDKNDERDKNIYKNNPNFWATRPLTQKMIAWASSDVDKLIVLAKRQKEQIPSARIGEAQELSRKNVTAASDMNIKRGLSLRGVHPGRFIGSRGSNIRSLQRRTGTLIYSDPEYGRNAWMVFYPDDSSLKSVMREMGHW